MAQSFNKVILIGRAGKDPDMRYMANGTAQATFSLATSTSRKKADGDGWDETTEWHNIVLWAEAAERAATAFVKGDLIAVEGRITYRSWDKDDGTKQYRTEIIAQNVNVLIRRPKTEGAAETEWETGEE